MPDSASWVTVADTAVKIGLGALIASVFAYFHTKRQHRDQIERDARDRRLRLIEETLDHLSTFLSGVLRYFALLEELQRRGSLLDNLPENRAGELNRSEAELFDLFSQLGTAEMKLRVLGAVETADRVRDLWATAARLPRPLYAPRPALADFDIARFRSELSDKRTEVFVSLGGLLEGLIK